MIKWELALAGYYFNTDWNDAPKVSVVTNQPEVGPPIARLRSRSVMHAFTGTMDMTYDEYQVFKYFVMHDLHGGIDRFLFHPLMEMGDKDYHANLVMSNGQPYTVKRKNESLYSVSVTINYYETGAIDA